MSLKPHKRKILALLLIAAMFPVIVNVLVHEWPLPDPPEPRAYRYDEKMNIVAAFDPHHDRLSSVFDDMIEAGRQEITRIDPSFWARGATSYYVSGSVTDASHAYSIGDPGSLYYATCGNQCSSFNPQPGDTIWVRGNGGTYHINTNPSLQAYSLRQNGSAGNPITYRRYGEEHAVIDCKGAVTPATQCLGQPFWHGSTASGGGNYVTVWGLDFINTSTQARTGNDSSGSCNACGPTELNEVFLSASGNRLINNFISDQLDGVQWSSGPAQGGGIGKTAKVSRGNVTIYSGFCGTTVRCYGHGDYVSNWPADGESGRSYDEGNIGLRSFDVGTQLYTHGGGEGYITFDHNSIIAPGHAVPITAAWPAVSTGVQGLYIGAQGSIAQSCDPVAYTDLFYNSIVDSNTVYAGTSGIRIGGSGPGKGLCNSQITNNYLAETGQFSVVGCAFNQNCSNTVCTNPLGCGMFPTFTFTGNSIFLLDPICPAGSCGGFGGTLALSQANYPSNTYANGLPSSGKQFFYWTSPDENGVGKVDVFNWDNSSTVTINLNSMGCFAGMQYQLTNYQDPNPWTGFVVATGTCTGSGDTATVSATTTHIQQPGFTTDGSTLVSKPADMGPTFVGFILHTNVAAGAGTPTPTVTNTATNTNTPTNTPTQTPTPTLTPTNTVTATQTLTPTNTVTVTQTLTPSQTPTVTQTPPNVPGISFGVNKCVAFAPMSVVSDSSAISGFHASSTTANNGDLVCKFNIPQDGTYRVWIHVAAQASNADSFFLEVNGDNNFNSLTPTPTVGATTPTPTATPAPASTHVFDTAEQLQPLPPTVPSCLYTNLGYLAYVWNPMNDRTAYNAGCTGNFAERDVTLLFANNPQEIAFRAREATGGSSAQLDYLYLCLNDCEQPNLNPTPTPTAGPPSCLYQFLCKGRVVNIKGSCLIPVQNPCQGGN